MMCKPHDQLHYQPVSREVAAILAGEGNSVSRDLLLRYATVAGLMEATNRLAQVLTPMEIVRVKSRLEAERAAVQLAARDQLTTHLVGVVTEDPEEVPF
jgi:hypothetical protein